MSGLKAAAILALLLVLSGCATQAPPTRTSAIELPSVSEFVRQGRFVLRTEELNEAPEAVQGGFVWRDAGGRLFLDLNNPFGSTLARVLVEPGLAVLTKANGETMRSSDPDALVQHMIGRRIPVRDIRVWLRYPLPASSAMQQVKRDEQGRIISFVQDGWGVELGRFDAQGPKLLALSRMQGSTKVSIRLVVDTP